MKEFFRNFDDFTPYKLRLKKKNYIQLETNFTCKTLDDMILFGTDHRHCLRHKIILSLKQ